MVNSYKKVPFPDKYNDHNIQVSSFNPVQFPISDQDKAAAKTQADITGNEATEADMPIIINKFITANKTGNQRVANGLI